MKSTVKIKIVNIMTKRKKKHIGKQKNTPAIWMEYHEYDTLLGKDENKIIIVNR